MKADYTNSEMNVLINEHIHNERDRELVRRKLCDGITFECLGCEFGLSTQRVKTIVYKARDKLFRYL